MPGGTGREGQSFTDSLPKDSHMESQQKRAKRTTKKQNSKPPTTTKHPNTQQPQQNQPKQPKTLETCVQQARRKCEYSLYQTEKGVTTAGACREYAGARPAATNQPNKTKSQQTTKRTNQPNPEPRARRTPSTLYRTPALRRCCPVASNGLAGRSRCARQTSSHTRLLDIKEGETVVV